MDEGEASGESASAREGPVQFEREEDPFGLNQFLDTVGWRAASAGSGSSSCSGGDGVDMNMQALQELLIYTIHKGLPKMQLKRRPFLLQKFGASRREIQNSKMEN